MTDLLWFYVAKSPWIFAAHAILLLTVLSVWRRDHTQISHERILLPDLETAPLDDPGPSRILILASEHALMVARGQPVPIVGTTDVYDEFFSYSDTLIQTATNAFLYVGIAGTLFNLWHLGPNFWKSLFGGARDYDTGALSFAFAASLFGIAWALVVGFLDSAVCGRGRRRFADEVARAINRRLAKDTRNRVDLAVQEALGAFSTSARALLLELKRSVESVYAETSRRAEGAVVRVVDEIRKLREDSGEFWQQGSHAVQGGAEAVVEASTVLRDAIAAASREFAAVHEGAAALSQTMAHLDSVAVSVDDMIQRELGNLVRTTAEAVQAVTAEYREVTKAQERSLQERLAQLVDSVMQQIETGAAGFGRHLEAVDARLGGIAEIVGRSAARIDESTKELRTAKEALADRAATDPALLERLNALHRELSALRHEVTGTVRHAPYPPSEHNRPRAERFDFQRTGGPLPRDSDDTYPPASRTPDSDGDGTHLRDSSAPPSLGATPGRTPLPNPDRVEPRVTPISRASRPDEPKDLPQPGIFAKALSFLLRRS